MDPLKRPALSIGEPAPEFNLPDLEGNRHALMAYRGRVVIVNFWSAECPWSARVDLEIEAYRVGWAERVILLTLASNANEPVSLLTSVAKRRGIQPLLLDEERQVADLFGAQTTPHMFVIDEKGELCYQGAFDDVTFRRRTPSQAYLKQAVEALLAGRLPEPGQTSPYGCALVRYAE